MTNVNRRTVLAMSGASLIATAFPVRALTPQSAMDLVNQVVDTLNTIINSGKPEAAMYKDFEKLFADYADVEIIARYTLGADARSMSASDLKKYKAAFQGYMARKYGKRFREFIGGYVKVRGAKRVKSFVEVQTVARLSGTSPFEVSFHVSDKGGSEKFFNMYIEGVNLLLTERTEIQAMLDKRNGNLDKMIQDLQKAG